MNWQIIAVAVILGLAVFFLCKKCKKKDTDCGEKKSCC